MNRCRKTDFLFALALLLAFFTPDAAPCAAQAATRDKAGQSEAAEDKYDAPEHNDLGLFNSEWGFRLDAKRKVMPEFPTEALKAGAQGLVVLSLYQDGKGNAANIKVLESPHPALTRAAIAAAKQWKWREFIKDGIPRPTLSKLSFKFVIEGDAGRVEDPPDDEAFRNLSEIKALRLKAKWPDEGTPPAGQDKQN